MIDPFMVGCFHVLVVMLMAFLAFVFMVAVAVIVRVWRSM